MLFVYNKRLLFIVVLMLFNFQAKALPTKPYKKATNPIEYIIYHSEKSNIESLDEEYNLLYKKIIKNLPKEQDKENFRNKIKDLLNARNDCLKYSKNKESTPTKQENILIGCLKTWYGSMIDILDFNQKYPHLFNIPSSTEYLKEFQALNKSPYYNDKDEYDKELETQCSETHELYYNIFFPSNHPPFAKKEESYYGCCQGAAHPHWHSYSNFIITKGNETAPIFSSRNNLPYSTGELLVINNKIYLTESTNILESFKIDLTYWSNDLLPQKLRELNGNNHYLVFALELEKEIEKTVDYLRGMPSEMQSEIIKTPADPSKANHLKCILHYIKNSSDDSIKKLLSPGGDDIEDDYIEDKNIDGRGDYIFVKYSDFTKIKKQCRSK